MILQPKVDNAIKQGVFHKEREGTVQLRFHKVGEHTLKSKIEDNGTDVEKPKEALQFLEKDNPE